MHTILYMYRSETMSNLNDKLMKRLYIFATLLLLMAVSATAQKVIFPQEQQAGEAQLTEADGQWTLSNDLFSATFSVDAEGVLHFDGCEAMNLLPTADLFALHVSNYDEAGSSTMKCTRIEALDLEADPSAARASLRLPGKALEADFAYAGITATWRAVLRDGSHYLRTELTLKTRRELKMIGVRAMVYNVDTEAAAVPAQVGNTRGAVLANERIFCGLETPMGINTPTATGVEGWWSRQATLKTADTWNVSAVVGLIAPGQARRSFLCYSERERAVPWRAFPVYVSWYELNIDRNNDRDYTTNMNIDQCVDVVQHWKQDFYDKYQQAPAAFVWDDGWDKYGTWTFNQNFPNGFAPVDALAQEMGSGIGCWLGPVGGYGQSGNYRREYWNGKGGMQLSNASYYRVFYNACKKMLTDYDFRFFKFDGISAQWSSVGPDEGATGEENAEAIISAEKALRELKPDLFFNTTVGTWASPFWFHVSDAVWRQENDYGEIGTQGTDREKWITYRDRLVYQNFVQNSPLCPINTLMTHGFILTKFGNVSKSMDYAGILREMRCAFGCGSGMVELYADYTLMNSINGGKLWSDLADCMRWQKEQADVLPDIHWVGGNPWDGSKANVYGWAAWNGEKSVLTLRNPATSRQYLVTTLRRVFDIPDYVVGSITLSNAFEQGTITGLKTDAPIDIDTSLRIQLPASSVFVFNGTCDTPISAISSPTITKDVASDNTLYDLAGRRLPAAPNAGVYIQGGRKYLVK